MSDGFEWLDWLEPSGPFLAAPVLKKAFPQGLDTLDPNKRRALRQAYDEYRQALDDEDPDAGKFHAAWIDFVLRQGLEYDEDESGDNLKAADDLPVSLVSQVAEHGVKLRPDHAVVDDQNADKPMMLMQVYDPDVDLNEAIHGGGWASSPRERMVRLCRDTGTRLGLVTNGEHWLFVDAPVSAVSSFASWYARLWGPEPVLLQAFVALLGIRRFFVAEDEQIPALIDKSVEYQDEVTAALGEQVRRAVEVLIQALDKADVDRNRELLKDVDPRELYEAGLTVMMRLVFLLSAEERELLLLGDERYEANYAVSTLRMQLRGEDDAILQRRWDAWSRLLAIFRAIYGGIEHEILRMPALGGSLFDPDRFPFLEGRDKDSNWKTDPAKPLPIDNQTVLLLLDAIQLFEGRTLSYRGLDIEQLGYVYEGLLDHTVKRAKEVTLELDATKNAKQPWVKLGELESANLDGNKAVETLLKERTGSSASRVRNDLKKEVKPQQSISLLTACHNNQALHDQVKPYFHLIRTDSWGRPLVYPQGSFMVTTGEDRRQTGSHYTPTSLTEAIVRETLEPVVYVGPAKGKPREEWRLKSSEELLALKICDPAMGSGAFLVQVCRWLGERVVESWIQAEEAGKHVDITGSIFEDDDSLEPMPRDSDERAVNARRLIAERCIYGVDLNPLAVELAKLSVWLVTLAKGRPFGFLDHSLKCGDSLLGISRLNQLSELSLETSGTRQVSIFGQSIRHAVANSLQLRGQLRQTHIREIRDVKIMSALDSEARSEVDLAELIADAFIGAVLAANDPNDLGGSIDNIAVLADQAVQEDAKARSTLVKRTNSDLAKDAPNGRPRRPLHWPLEFPEVFQKEFSGFDAFVGNPPFLGGKKISSALGDNYRSAIVLNVANGTKGAADFSAYFFLRSNSLTAEHGCVGLLGTDSISSGDTGEVGLQKITSSGSEIYFAVSSMKWPGSAQVAISMVCWTRGPWIGHRTLDHKKVDSISWNLSTIDAGNISTIKLKQPICSSFAGTYINGEGFILSAKEANLLKQANQANCDVIFPYLGGEDLNSQVGQVASRYVINFGTMTSEKASKYQECFDIVTRKVKPYRDTLTKQIHEPDYWKFWDKRIDGYSKITELSNVLVSARASKYIQPTFVENGQVFSDQIVVFITDSFGVFAALQSSIHAAWAWQCCTKMGRSTIRYAPSKAIATFVPPSISDDLKDIGDKYYRARLKYEKKMSCSLTQLYNDFHNRSRTDDDLECLRGHQVQLDKIVAHEYRWHDIDLGHDFHEISYLPENDCVRFAISESARIEVLRRLAALNRTRHEEEIAERLAARFSPNSSPESKLAQGKKTKEQQNLDFGLHQTLKSSLAEQPRSGNEWGVNAVDQILAWLEAHKGWFSKTVILNGSGAPVDTWDATLAELLKDEFVESNGEGDDAKYRAKL